MGFRSSTKKMFASDEVKSNVVTHDTSQGVNIMIRIPNCFEDVHDYANALMQGNVLFLNLERLNGVDRNRVFDYLNGVAYVVSANVDTLGETGLIYSPVNVTIDKQEENKGVGFW